MKLTKKKAIELHRELWDWLYHYPSKHKGDWPEWVFNGGDISETTHDCFLCEYTDLKCNNCLLDWPITSDTGDPLSCCNSYYVEWVYSNSPKTRKKYAKLIRDLPERK